MLSGVKIYSVQRRVFCPNRSWSDWNVTEPSEPVARSVRPLLICDGQDVMHTITTDDGLIRVCVF